MFSSCFPKINKSVNLLMYPRFSVFIQGGTKVPVSGRGATQPSCGPSSSWKVRLFREDGEWDRITSLSGICM